MLHRLRIAASIAPYALLSLVEVILTQATEHTIPRHSLRRLGRRVYIPRSVSFRFPKNIVFASDVTLNPGDRLWASANARISIGEHTLLGPDVAIITANHGFADRRVLVKDQPQHEGDVRLGRDVWVGTRAVILPGVTIGDGAVIGAGAVVTRDVEAFTIVAGAPARVIGTRGAALASSLPGEFQE